MEKAKITSKGQVTIPKAVRDRLGLRPGDEIEFIEDNGNYKVKKTVLHSPFERYRGYLKHLQGRSSDEVIEELRGP